MIDSFFDVFNSRLPIADKQLRNPYGRYLIEQNKALENMEQYAKNAVVVGKEKRSFTFLKGLLVSINSLKSLFTFVSTRYGVKYNHTHRLNQDLLENLFSQVRAFGVTHDHPNAMEFRFRLRAILLSKTRAEIRRTANSTTDDSSAFVSAQVFVSGTACSDRNTVLPIVTARPTAVPKQIASALECDVVRYISGYVAKKLRKNYEELGDPTAKAEKIGESWVDHLSRGGLIQPSPDWYKTCLALESHFREHCGSSIRRIHTLSSLIESVPSSVECPKPAMILYFKVRLYGRIKQINKSFKDERNMRSAKKKTTKLTT